MTKGIYFKNHTQSSGVDILSVKCHSSNKLPLSIMIWCFYVLWTFPVIPNIICSHLSNLKEFACAHTINTKSFKATKHLEMLNWHDLLLQFKCRPYRIEYKYSFN